MELPSWLKAPDALASWEAGTKAGQQAASLNIQKAGLSQRKEMAADRLQMAYDALAQKERISELLEQGRQDRAKAAEDLKREIFDATEAARRSVLELRQKELDEKARQFGITSGQKDRQIGVSEGTLTERQRHNRASEGLLKQRFEDLFGSRQDRQAETERHNRAMEETQRKNIDSLILSRGGKGGEKPLTAYQWSQIMANSSPRVLDEVLPDGRTRRQAIQAQIDAKIPAGTGTNAVPIAPPPREPAGPSLLSKFLGLFGSTPEAPRGFGGMTSYRSPVMTTTNAPMGLLTNSIPSTIPTMGDTDDFQAWLKGMTNAPMK